MFYEAIEKMARKGEKTPAAEKKDARTAKLDAKADAFLKAHGYDPNGNKL